MARVLNAFCCCQTLHKKSIHASNPFTLVGIFLTFASIGSFLADISTDIIVIIQYYINGHILWMLLTTTLVCVPSFLVQIFSIRWYIIDGKVSKFLWLVHVLQLGVFQRYIQLLHLGLKIREDNTFINLRNFNQQQSDVCMLRLFESFMESAPQLVLQLYIMVSTDEWNPWTGISAVASIFSLGWGIAAYSKAMRNVQPEKSNLSWWGLLFQSLWRIGMVSSRVISMVLFATVYGSWLILIMAIHWFCMTVWIIFQNTDFCTTWWEERLYNCVVGVIYCFCFFNIQEGQTRYRMSVYYVLVISQNISFLSAFFIAERSTKGLKYFMMLFVPPSIIIGIGSLLLYYRYFHPTGQIEIFKTKQVQVIATHEVDGKMRTRSDSCTLKTCRKLKDAEIACVENGHTTNNGCFSFIVEEEKDLNISRASIKSLNNISCISEIHRSHSLNCSSKSHLTDNGSFLYLVSCSRKSIANHHRNVNYHFRPAVLNGLSSIKIHCSCLILVQDSICKLKTTTSLAISKYSKSMPNLEINLEHDNLETPHLSPKSYLIQDSICKLKTTTSLAISKYSKSMPNLEINLEHDNLEIPHLSPKSYLIQDSISKLKTTTSLAISKYSKSMPNLEINLECDNLEIPYLSSKSYGRCLLSSFISN